MKAVPYYSQWESRQLVSDFLSGKLHPADDPLWHLSGGIDRDKYARWSFHICGMACLKMLLADWHDRIIPTLELMKQCRDYGGYVVQEDGSIKGLFYRPFVSFIAEKYGLQAEVKEHTPIEEIYDLLDQGYVYMASVHPTIRTPEVTPPNQGGHLVYVFGRDAKRRELIFHNPSGNTVASQENVHLSCEGFARFYAKRGILIKDPRPVV
ncbi:C39 family peptidase [Brevibacillus halotolerans]|uniref:C39 family peptidase n=1 Tax=Brevibacillus TaxID=55080 RepID=UPI00215C7C90|nr:MULTISPECIES: C39 family peptidase [Brevibacillus]MCR8964942.1 C39 family peptidase [Brevibacillus laterosporus]MCZ0837097.1 C39 family peptidase [Brevibacillus halotolerans]